MRIKLTTEWVEWKCLSSTRGTFLFGAIDNVAAILPSHDDDDDAFDLFVCIRTKQGADGWYYPYTSRIREKHATVEEAKEACLRILVEYDLLDPLTFLLTEGQ